MVRGPKTTLAVVAAFVLVGAAAVFYWREHTGLGPTSDEYRVYGALLTRLAADNNWRPNEVALLRTTLQLTDAPSDSWVPAELQHDKMIPPQYGVSFCGDPCGREFVKRNLVTWRLNSTARGEVGFPIVGPSKEMPPEIPPKYRVVGVTRVGFNVWHTRAFLDYSADCNDYSPEHPTMCLELGEACLQKKNGVWKVDHYSAATF